MRSPQMWMSLTLWSSQRRPQQLRRQPAMAAQRQMQRRPTRSRTFRYTLAPKGVPAEGLRLEYGDIHSRLLCLCSMHETPCRIMTSLEACFSAKRGPRR